MYNIFSKKIIICNPNDKIINALDKMVKYRLRRLPVVEGKAIVGELTLHQLIIKFYAATQYHPLIENEEG